MNSMPVIYFIVLGLVCIGAGFDLAIKKIPNIILLLILILGIGGNTFFSEGMGLSVSIYGILAGFILMLFFYCFASLGAGDVKLMAALGSVVGYKVIPYIAAYSFVISGFLAMTYIIFNKDIFKLFKRIGLFFSGLFKGVNNYKKPDDSDSASLRMPMAPTIALSMGYMIYFVI